MKKTFRKITAALSAALMCALPMANAVTANAANKNYYAGQKLTFRNTISINTYGTKVYEFDYDLKFNDNVKNDMVLKNYRKLFGADNFSCLSPSAGRTCINMRSGALYHIDAPVIKVVYDTANWRIDTDGIKSGAAYSLKTSAYGDYWNNNSYFDYEVDFNSNISNSFVLVGDANGDGEIRMNDANIIDSLAKNMDPGVDYFDTEAADVDGNGTIDNYDATLVCQFLINKIQSFADYQA